jgi:hypothetical protein
MAHGAFRVGYSNFGKRFFSLLILERMKPGDCAIELSLRLRRTGDRETHAPEFLTVLMPVPVAFLCGCKSRMIEKRDYQQYGDQEGTFHFLLLWMNDESGRGMFGF